MKAVNSQLYRSLIDLKVPEEQAREAAEIDDIVQLSNKVTALFAGQAIMIALILFVITKVS